MKVLITGGRVFTNAVDAFYKLDQFHALVPITELIHGDAEGADALAKLWAEQRGIVHHPEPVPPESWQRLGGRAGNARNSLMLRKWEPEVVIAFPGNSGTLDMVKKARAQKTPTFMTWSADYLSNVQKWAAERHSGK